MRRSRRKMKKQNIYHTLYCEFRRRRLGGERKNWLWAVSEQGSEATLLAHCPQPILPLYPLTPPKGAPTSRASATSRVSARAARASARAVGAQRRHWCSKAPRMRRANTRAYFSSVIPPNALLKTPSIARSASRAAQRRGSLAKV